MCNIFYITREMLKILKQYLDCNPKKKIKEICKQQKKYKL